MKDGVIPKIKLNNDFDAAVLVCFLLSEIGALTEKLLLEIVTFDDIVEVFTFSDALGMSERKSLIEAFNKDNETYYRVTEYGKNVLNEFINTIPLSIREKTLGEGKRCYALHLLKKSFKWGIEKAEKGYFFKVSLLNETGGPDIVNVRIYAPDEKNAVDIEKRFLEKPADIIGKILEMFI